MLINKIGYSYNDITIVPSVISYISSRSECNPYYENDKLPIFASPMASVVSEKNYKLFEENHITPILPRIKEYDINYRIEKMHQGWWVAVSLKELEEYIINDLKTVQVVNKDYRICIDIANGHMKCLYDKCIEAKRLAYERGIRLIIMTGNIANAETYRLICRLVNYLYEDAEGHSYKECAIDYIRVGIGGGHGCLTTSNVSIHYPQASLINECKQEKIACENKYARKFPAIVADGGIRNYDHVIKALALGADYVMIGSVFAQCIESAGEKTNKNLGQKLSIEFPVGRYKDFYKDENENWWGYYNEEFIKHSLEPWQEAIDDAINKYGAADNEVFEAKAKYEDKIKDLESEKFIGKIDVKFFGMASADGQKSMSGEKTKTSEGITKWLPVKYTLSGWVENMISYLRSAMSYTDCRTLDKFIGKPDLIVNSISEIQAVNK